jgi:Family of unknown function (DUF6364)
MRAKQNLTISLAPQTVRKAKIIAARKGTSISGLVAQQVERLIGEDETYRRAERGVLSLFDRSLPLGTNGPIDRDKLHER